MADSKNWWKMFGISVIALVVVTGVLATGYLLGRSDASTGAGSVAGQGESNTDVVASPDVTRPAPAVSTPPTTAGEPWRPANWQEPWTHDIILKWADSDPSLYAAFGYKGEIPPTGVHQGQKYLEALGGLEGTATVECAVLSKTAQRVSTLGPQEPRMYDKRMLTGTEWTRMLKDIVEWRCPENL